MRTIDSAQIATEVAKLIISASHYLPDDIYQALSSGIDKEKSPVGKDILRQLVKNACIAREGVLPICQDTGMAVVFVDLGEDVRISGGNINDAINTGVARAYVDGYLRKSAVSDPLFVRKNTGDNTPAIIHVSIVPGDKLKLTVLPKGFGGENMSALKMFSPSAGVEGVKKFVVDTVLAAGPNACPPIVIGMGIGGSMEMAALLSKKALARPIDQRSADPEYAKLEEELLELVNKTGVGPQGLGGTVTALAVNINHFPTHIGAMPCAININCHVVRHAEIEI